MSERKRVLPRLPLASEFIADLELVWQDQISNFPELRPAFIRFDKLKSSKGYVKVNYAGIQYANGQVYHDVMIRDTIIDLELGDMMQALYHAMAHCLNYDRGVIDTTRGYRHGEEFKKTAEEIGLETFWVDGFGYMTRLGEIKNKMQFVMRKHRIKQTMPFKMVKGNGSTI